MSVVEKSEILLPDHLADEELVLHHGWEPHLGHLLVEKSQELFMEEWVPKDAGEYYTDPDAVDRWFKERAKEPLVVWLGTLAGDLAGIAYLTNPNRIRNKEKELTVLGVRVYEGFRNQGMGTLLCEELHHRYDEMPHGNTQFTMLKNNNAAFALGIKFGYRLEKEYNNSQTMVRRT